MQRIIASLLIVISLGSGLWPNLKLWDVLLAPRMVEHYELHRQADASLDLGEFLLEHMFGEHRTSKQHSHDKLPTFSHISVLSFAEPIYCVVCTITTLPEIFDFKLFSQGLNTRLAAGSIFHPPRVLF